MSRPRDKDVTSLPILRDVASDKGLHGIRVHQTKRAAGGERSSGLATLHLCNLGQGRIGKSGLGQIRNPGLGQMGAKESLAWN